MAKYTQADCRLCRREGTKLFLNGERCTSKKCAIERRPLPPGQHGAGRKKVAEYGTQLREKQKVRRYYGVLEGQFAKYFEMANKKKGITGENLLSILESRLDNVIYRLGFAASRAEARQLVVHGHFLINDKKVNIPSYLIKPGDSIAVRDKSKSSEKIKTGLERAKSKTLPKWLEMNRDTFVARVASLAQRDDIDLEIAEHLIVELYSK